MKPKTQQHLLLILIPSFIVIVVWIVASIYNHAAMSTITVDQSISIEPIEDTFDTRVLDSLKKRTVITSNTTAQIAAPAIDITLTPTPELTAAPEASPSGGDLP